MSIIEYTGPSTPQEIHKYLMRRRKDEIVSEYLRQWREFGKVERERDGLRQTVTDLRQYRDDLIAEGEALKARLEAAENGWNSSSEVVDHLSTKLCASELHCSALEAHVERLNTVIFQVLTAIDDGDIEAVPFDLARDVYNDAPDTSLASHDAVIQAATLGWLLGNNCIKDADIAEIRERMAELRRQAEDPTA